MKVSGLQRNLLMRLLIGSTTLLISSAAYYSYQVVRNLTLESLKRNAFLEVQQGAESIDSWLAKLKVHVTTLANTSAVRSMDWTTAEPYLKAEVIRFSDVSTIGISKLDGQEHTIGEAPGNVSGYSFFQNAIAGQTTVSDPLLNDKTKTEQVIVAAPIWQQFDSTSAPVGEIHSTVSLDRMTQVVEQLKYGENSYALALNSQGQAIVHPNLASSSGLDSSGAQSGHTADLPITQHMIHKQPGIELEYVDGTWQYVAYLPLQEADWSVVLVIPRANIESQLRSLDIIALVIGGLATTMIVMLWQVQSLEQQQLKKSNEKLEQRVAERTSELSTTLEQLQQSQSQLVQHEKMSSLGQMVAGVAHEINNPVNFIHGNLLHINEYSQNLLSLIHLYQQEYPNNSPRIAAAIDDVDLEFIVNDLPKTVSSMRVGTERIREIVRSLRTFSRLDEAEFKTANIHEGLDSTLMILHNRLRAKPEHSEIQVIKEYGDIPDIDCYPGQLNQVFMNLLSNAIDALDDYNQQHATDEIKDVPSCIRIRTNLIEGDRLFVSISDNGAGISNDVQARLFDPFFTTKPVGKGTGLGLAISYQIIVERHGGKLSCHSIPGEGSEFVIELPVYQNSKMRFALHQ